MSNREAAPLESQVRILFGSSSGRCAYPGCGKPLSIANKSGKDLPKNTAKVGHITAASPGGPRYDASMTTEQRRSESNLILLCGDHHDAVDSQLDFHSAEWLMDAKTRHVKKMDRAAGYAMGVVGFKELQIICDSLVMGVATNDEDEIVSIDTPIDIDAKLRLNELSATTRSVVEVGLAQSAEVEKFLTTMDNVLIGFSSRLTNRFKGLYFLGLSEDVHGDELFASILGSTYENCGANLTAELRAAAQAVVCYLFSICEIFEHEPTSSR